MFKTEPKFTKNALAILEKRYLRNSSETGLPETPKEMLVRVASNLSLPDANYGATDEEARITANMFYEEMASLRFLPNSPTLMNAGTDLQQLSACFTLPVGDSLDDIFESAKTSAIIHRSGGGTTFSFSSLRPSNDFSPTAKGVSSGPVSFMGVFNAATETISHTGIRCGLNTGTLHMSHPDIEEFIFAKGNKALNLSSFILAVIISDDFMEAARLGQGYPLVDPSTGKVVGEYDAGAMLDKIADLTTANSSTAPRIIFEQPTSLLSEGFDGNLQDHEACNLASINLGKFVSGGEIAWDDLRKTVHVAVHFLDNLIDATRFPTKAIAEATQSQRKIGIGVMGFANMLAMLEAPYGSVKSLAIASEVMGFIRDESRLKSAELGAVRGSFSGFEFSPFATTMGYDAMRNAATTAISPTRSIAIIADASFGIEPYFSIAYHRLLADDANSDNNASGTVAEVVPYFLEVSKREGFYSAQLMDEVARSASLKGVSGVPAKWQDVFATACDVAPEQHSEMQWAFQEHSDAMVSKTINMGENSSASEVRDLITQAHKLGLKSLDIYVYKRVEEPATTPLGKEQGEHSTVLDDVAKLVVRERPKVLSGKTMEIMTGCGKLYVTTNMDNNGRAFEVFTRMGKVGGCASSYTEAIGRLVSVSLRAGIGVDKISRQLKGISCHMPYGFGQNKVLSCADAVGKALGEIHEESVMVASAAAQEPDASIMDSLLGADTFPKQNTKAMVVHHPGACPECGGPVSPVEGCDVCYSCGYSHCN